MEKLVYPKIPKASHFLSPCFLNGRNIENLGLPKAWNRVMSYHGNAEFYTLPLQ